VATKALATGLANKDWYELTQDGILSVSDFGETYGDDKDDDKGNNDNDSAFIDVEYKYDDLEDAGDDDNHLG
jgi:hypothetical protein